MVCVSVEAKEAVSAVGVYVPSADVSGVDESELKLLLADARVAQRCLDGYVMRLGLRANHLARQGKSAPGDEAIRGEGTTQVSSRQARAEAKRVKTAEGFPGLGDAVSSGETSGDHIDSVGRHLGKLTDEQRSSIDDDDVIAKARSLPADAFDGMLKQLANRARQDHGLGDTKAKQAASEFRHWFDQRSGMGKFCGSLDPERYEALVNAVEQHTNRLATVNSAEPGHDAVSKDANLAAEALVQLVTSVGDRSARNRLPSVTVVVDHDTVVHGAHDHSTKQTENGHDLAPETIARLCCDATIRKVTLDENGVPINVGRKYRTATDAQWAAIKAVHDRCAWVGCVAPINWCQAHHIREWEHDGPTDLDNLVPLCSRHHHRVHEGQWHIKMLPDRSLEISKPNRTHHATVPRPTRQ